MDTYHNLILGHDDFSRIREKTHGCKSYRGGVLYKARNVWLSRSQPVKKNFVMIVMCVKAV